MTHHTESMLVLSTGHVPESEAQAINDGIRRGVLNGMYREEGWLLHTSSLVGTEGFPHVNYLMGYAAGMGHEWLLLDNAASLVDDLLIFDW